MCSCFFLLCWLSSAKSHNSVVFTTEIYVSKTSECLTKISSCKNARKKNVAPGKGKKKIDELSKVSKRDGGNLQKGLNSLALSSSAPV